MIYVTGNNKKFEEAQIILNKIKLQQCDLDLPETQGSCTDILRAKAQDAWKLLEKPFIIEDVSFEAEALGGMPGPYIKDFLFALANKNLTLFDILSPLGNTKATAVCSVAFVKNKDEIITASGQSSGTVVSPKGDLNHGKVSFNKVFRPKESHKTYGEMTMKEHALYSARSRALKKLLISLSPDL